MQKKEKKQWKSLSSPDENMELENYRVLLSVTTMHPELNEGKAEAVKKAIEELPDD